MDRQLLNVGEPMADEAFPRDLRGASRGNFLFTWQTTQFRTFISQSGAENSISILCICACVLFIYLSFSAK